MYCAICQSEKLNSKIIVKEMMFGSEKQFHYLSCQNCGCLQQELSHCSENTFYNENYYSFSLNKMAKFRKYLKSRATLNSVRVAINGGSFIKRIATNPRRAGGAYALKGLLEKSTKLLDVGCGDGSLVVALNNLGYRNAQGIDPYLEQDIITNGINLRKVNIENYLGEKIFDIIMFNHSFEHMRNPLEVLTNAKRLIKDDGLIIIRIPTSDSYAYTHYRESWVQIDAPRHLFLHTNKSMGLLVANVGMKIKDIIDDSDEFQFIGSEQYRASISLGDVRSYYVPWYKKLFFNKQHIFDSHAIKKFKQEAVRLNLEGQGDQRIFYIGT